MKSPEKQIEDFIMKQYKRYMKKANRALRKYKNDDDYSKKLRENPHYRKALEWCEVLRHYNIMCMKEESLEHMTKFLRQKDLYAEFCHWEYGDEEGDKEC